MASDSSRNLPSNPRLGTGVAGMGSVIATVSGYHGMERNALIKLITLTGASYVGALQRSTTHLVCWKLEGAKFDLARRLGTKMISHQWFEDCLREQRCLPEEPYLMKCGKQTGHLTWKMPDLPANEQGKCRLSKKKRIFCDQTNTICISDAVDTSSSFMDAIQLDFSDLSSDEKHISSSHGRKMVSRSSKSAKRTLGRICTSNTRHLSDRLDNVPLSSLLASTSSRVISQDMAGVGTSYDVQPVHKARRLIKRNALSDSSNFLSHNPIDQDLFPTEFGNRHDDTTECIDIDRMRTRTLLFPSEGQQMENQSAEGSPDTRIELLEDVQNSGNDPLSIHSNYLTESGELTHRLALRNDHCAVEHDQNEDREDYDDLGDLNSMADLSCVICLTNFSSNRGVLPCGHRYCYLCIQGWADYMVSTKKSPTCPLCKMCFTSITKIEETVSSDQKIFSQTIPVPNCSVDVLVFQGRESDNVDVLSSETICCECRNHEPEDLLVSCHVCHERWVHSCCLDPPMVPWTCAHCRDLRVLYQFRSYV